MLLAQKFDMLMSFASSQFWVYGSKRLVPYSEPFDKRVYNSSESETAKVTTKQIEFTEWVTVDGYHFHMKQASGRIVHETIQVYKAWTILFRVDCLLNAFERGKGSRNASIK